MIDIVQRLRTLISYARDSSMKTDTLEDAKREIERLRRDAQAVQQPVAYRWKYEDETSWTLAKSKPNHLFYQKDVICEPLYTLPSTEPAQASQEPTLCEEAKNSGFFHDGVDEALTLLCKNLGVDPGSVSWDAATETVEGDVSAVIGNILRAKFGEDWDPSLSSTHPQPEEITKEEMDAIEAAAIAGKPLSEAYPVSRPNHSPIENKGE